MNELFEPKCVIDQIVIIAPGPSLTEEQVNMVMKAGKFTIAVGEAWRYALYADILYHADGTWWKYHQGCPEFRGDLKISHDPTGIPGIKRVLGSLQSEGFDVAPYVVSGGNSGYQAINIATFFQPREIILVGFDMKDAADGRHLMTGDHPRGVKRPFNPERKVKAFSSLVEPLEAVGIKVYNCTLDTALTCFEKRELIDVL